MIEGAGEAAREGAARRATQRVAEDRAHGVRVVERAHQQRAPRAERDPLDVEPADQIGGHALAYADHAAGARPRGVAEQHRAVGRDEHVHRERDRPLRQHLLPGRGDGVRPRERVGDREEGVAGRGTRLLATVVGDVERAGRVEVEAAERVEAGGHRGRAVPVQPDDPLAARAEGALPDQDGAPAAQNTARDRIRRGDRMRRVSGRGDDRRRRGPCRDENCEENKASACIHRTLLSKVNRSTSTARRPSASRPAARSDTVVRRWLSGMETIFVEPGVTRPAALVRS